MTEHALCNNNKGLAEHLIYCGFRVQLYMVREHRSYVLKLDKDDPDKEIQFEMDFLLSLTTAERFEMMFRASNLVRDILIRNGHRKPSEIIKRT